MWEWVLRVLGNCGRNIKLGQKEFIDVDLLSKASGFSVVTSKVRKGYISRHSGLYACNPSTSRRLRQKNW